MGEVQGNLFEPEFNRSTKVQSSPERITSHARAVVLREIDHRLGMIESLGETVCDPRHSDKICHPPTELLRERLSALALGSENQDDLDRLGHDPAMRVGSGVVPMNLRFHNPTAGGRLMELSYGSYYPGDAMFTFADGAVQFLAESLGFSTYQAHVSPTTANWRPRSLESADGVSYHSEQ